MSIHLTSSVRSAGPIEIVVSCPASGAERIGCMSITDDVQRWEFAGVQGYTLVGNHRRSLTSEYSLNICGHLDLVFQTFIANFAYTRLRYHNNYHQPSSQANLRRPAPKLPTIRPINSTLNDTRESGEAITKAMGRGGIVYQCSC